MTHQSRSDKIRFLAVGAKYKQQRAEVSRTSCTSATRKLSRCRSQLRLELSQIPRFLPNWECLIFFAFNLISTSFGGLNGQSFVRKNEGPLSQGLSRIELAERPRVPASAGLSHDLT